jgi:hypothetical protein
MLSIERSCMWMVVEQENNVLLLRTVLVSGIPAILLRVEV